MDAEQAAMAALTAKLASMTDREILDCLALAKQQSDRYTVCILAAEAASRDI